MYSVSFYRDRQGREPVKEHLLELAAKQDKNSRIQLNKIRDYIAVLKAHGTRAGEPYVKPLQNGIWELRPQNGRILFAAWAGGQFVLLHIFAKKPKKPRAGK